ncbi:hypothetical protein SLEP1_g31640 [Rubroshorea leprosula]|uniref:Uncharacterized protein n=1 Tax=Rubroshorea leprosula TaxID=152421 RepID=A0AAV5K3Z0_9ROSI|nr:hypothetical protein SLEP1_g31640 [Rubroshorea leprosula]
MGLVVAATYGPAAIADGQAATADDSGGSSSSNNRETEGEMDVRDV